MSTGGDRAIDECPQDRHLVVVHGAERDRHARPPVAERERVLDRRRGRCESIVRDRPELGGHIGHRRITVAERPRPRGQKEPSVETREPLVAGQAVALTEGVERFVADIRRARAPSGRLHGHVPDSQPFRGDPRTQFPVLVDDDVRSPTLGQFGYAVGHRRSDRLAEGAPEGHDRTPTTGQSCQLWDVVNDCADGVRTHRFVRESRGGRDLRE